MMGGSGYYLRIAGALFVAGSLIGSAYWLAKDAQGPTRVEASAQSALLKAITTRDTDGDGLPDWQEALYGTDPHKVDTKGLGMSDAEAVAKGLVVPKAVADVPLAAPGDTTIVVDGVRAPAEGTLTAAFAQSFFTLYLQAKENAGGNDLTESEMQAVADQAIASLASTIESAPDYKRATDIKVSGAGAEALTSYLATVETILLTNTARVEKGELAYLKDALEKNDEKALASLTEISKVYRAGAVGLAQLSVPEEVAGAHLALVNSFMRLSQIQADFARVHDDPLAAVFALEQYPYAGLAFTRAFAELGQVYKKAGITLAPGSVGSQLLQMVTTTTVPEPKGAQP